MNKENTLWNAMQAENNVTCTENGDKAYKTEQSTTVTIEDIHSGLADDQTYYYAWSENAVNEPSYDSENTFVNGDTIIASGYIGSYYLCMLLIPLVRLLS